MADDPAHMKTSDPMFLFNLFQSDIIAAEIDWDEKRFLLCPMQTEPDPTG